MGSEDKEAISPRYLPPYVGSQRFIGRADELRKLGDWSASATSKEGDPLLVIRGPSGSGKSALANHWVRHRRTARRSDWRGVFWYSFEERGAAMAEFCRHSLSYTTGSELGEFVGLRMAELSELLIEQLQASPWLVVLDGLDVLYSCLGDSDESELPEIAEQSQSISQDDLFLQRLTTVGPSQVLITTEIIPGCLKEVREADGRSGCGEIELGYLKVEEAETLLSGEGTNSEQEETRKFLNDNERYRQPLAANLLAGAIANYPPEPGNFGGWLANGSGGAALTKSLDEPEPDRGSHWNHLIEMALEGADDKSVELLSMLALISEPVNTQFLKAVNPFLPEDQKLEKQFAQSELPPTASLLRKKEEALKLFEEEENRKKEGSDQNGDKEKHLVDRHKRRLEKADEEREEAEKKLMAAAKDLNRRGLLGISEESDWFGLHPRIAKVILDKLEEKELAAYGHRIVTRLQHQAPRFFDRPECLNDLSIGICLVKLFQKMGMLQKAATTFADTVSHPMILSLEAYQEAIALMRPFFPDGWHAQPKIPIEKTRLLIANYAGYCLSRTGREPDSLKIDQGILEFHMDDNNWREARTQLSNLGLTYLDVNDLQKAEYCFTRAREIADLSGNKQGLFIARLQSYLLASHLGRWAEADYLWSQIDPHEFSWNREVYRMGYAEYCYALNQFYQGKLDEWQINRSRELAVHDSNRFSERQLNTLEGEHYLEAGMWRQAKNSFSRAVRMTRETGVVDELAEAGLAHARQRLGELEDTRAEAKRLADMKYPAHRYIAEIWLTVADAEEELEVQGRAKGEEIDDLRDQRHRDTAEAMRHGDLAYRWAWANGKPYVRTSELDKCKDLLERLFMPEPLLPACDADGSEKPGWVERVDAAVDTLRRKWI